MLQGSILHQLQLCTEGHFHKKVKNSLLKKVEKKQKNKLTTNKKKLIIKGKVGVTLNSKNK